MEYTSAGKLTFLITFLLTFLIAGILWRTLLSKHSEPNKNHIQDLRAPATGTETPKFDRYSHFASLLIGILVGAFLLGFVLWLGNLRTDLWFNEAQAFLTTAMLAKLIIAILSGVFASAMFWFVVNNKDASQVVLLVLIHPPVFLFLLGYFDTEIRKITGRLTKLETPYASITILPPANEQKKMEIVAPEGKISIFDMNTDFTVGLRTINYVLEKSSEDTKNIFTICKSVMAANCSNIEQEEIYQTIKANSDYLQELLNIGKCLARYGTLFPDGVPIQGELSEIAAIYETIARDSQLNEPRKYINELSNINRRIGDLGKQVRDMNQKITDAFKMEGTGTSSGKNSEPSQNTGDSSKVDGDNVEDSRGIENCHIQFKADAHQRQLYKVLTLLKMPTRAGTEAGFMIAAGYPAEGARHLTKQNSVLKDKQLTKMVNQFPYFVIKQRLLSLQEGALEYVREYKGQRRELDELNELTDGWLNKLANVSIGNFKEAIEACSEGFPKIDYINADPATRDYVISYVAKQLYFLISTHLREAYTVSYRLYPDAESSSYLDDELNLAKDMWQQARLNFSTFTNCFIFRNATIVRSLELTRIRLLSNYGLLLNAKVVNMTRNSNSNDTEADQRIRESLCLAKSTLQEGLDYANSSWSFHKNDVDFENLKNEVFNLLQQVKSNIKLSEVDCAA